MRIGIIGAGAVGGFLGAKLALSGQDVTFFDRPAVINAITDRGLTILETNDVPPQVATDFKATSDIANVGRQDVVILATKADHLSAIAPLVADISAPDAAVVTVQNGLPWWYFLGGESRAAGNTLTSLDPTGTIAAHIDAQNVIGCVVYPAVEMTEPGVIHHVYGWRLPVGEANGIDSPRAQLLSNALIQAGFSSRVLTDIRSELWLKALGAAVLNPVSVITGGTLEAMCNDPYLRPTIHAAMQEAQNVATKLGIEFRRTIDERIAGAASVGAHKTSMLQAYEANSPLELDATTGVVCELARMTETPAPLLEAIYAYVRFAAKETR